MNAEIVSALGTYIAKSILKQPNRQIEPTSPIISSGLVDSFSLVDLALYIEDTWGVHIDDTELNAQTFDSLEQLSGLIEARLG